MKLFNEHEKYVIPYYNTDIIVDESFLPLRKKDDSDLIVISMMNKIKRVIEVRRADRSKTYKEGTDYILKDGNLVIPKDSEIEIMSWDEYCLTNSGEPVFESIFGGNLYFENTNEFHKRQYQITYESADNCFDGHYVPKKSELLPHSQGLLESSDPLKLAFYGDSITFGMNASGLFDGIPPYMPIYPRLVTEVLEKRGKKMNYYNPSISGISSSDGVKMADSTLGKFAPDLTVIAFGMNDATEEYTDKAAHIGKYISNIKGIIDTARRANKNAEFILVSTTLPNPWAKNFNKIQGELEAPLCKLAQSENAAFLNMTSLHKTILARKEYYHMTGNNINHPSDFLARLYAQGILTLFGQ